MKEARAPMDRGLAIGILHFTAPPLVGGVETVIGEHARRLAAAGHRVRLIAGRGGPVGPDVELRRLPLADSRHPDIVALRGELAVGRVTSRFSRLRDALVPELVEAVDDLDVLVVHNVCSLPVNLALTAGLRVALDGLGGPPLVAWHHDLPWSSGRYAREIHPGRPWDLLTAPWPRSVQVVISEARRVEYARMTDLSTDRIRVIPNGIDRLRFLSIHPATRARLEPLALPDRSAVLLAPVRITRRKNLELAIRVLAELRSDGEDARLVVTGPPDPHDPTGHTYLTELEALAAALDVREAIHLLSVEAGPVSDRMVADLYRVADALLLPSRDEGFGLPLLEAAACRLPVFCAELPPLREIAGDDAVYLDPSATPAELAALVRAGLLDERAHRLSLRVRTAFGWQAILDERIEPLLRQVAASD